MRMRNRRRGALVARVIMVVALTAAACGSEAPVSDVASAPPVTATASDATGRAEALTDRLIGQLGSDTAATDAVLLAMEVGYDHAQLLAAIDGNALQPDGRIAGVDPAGPELGVVELAAGAAAAAPVSEGDLVLVSFQSGGERTPVAELRAGVANLAEVLGSGDDSAVQRPPTHYVLLLLVQGFPFEIVMQAIVLGPDAPADHGVPPLGRRRPGAADRWGEPLRRWHRLDARRRAGRPLVCGRGRHELVDTSGAGGRGAGDRRDDRVPLRDGRSNRARPRDHTCSQRIRDRGVERRGRARRRPDRHQLGDHVRSRRFQRRRLV